MCYSFSLISQSPGTDTHLTFRKKGRIFRMCYKTYCYHAIQNFLCYLNHGFLHWIFKCTYTAFQQQCIRKHLFITLSLVSHALLTVLWSMQLLGNSVVQWVSNRDVCECDIISVTSLKDQPSPAWDCIKNTSAICLKAQECDAFFKAGLHLLKE